MKIKVALWLIVSCATMAQASAQIYRATFVLRPTDAVGTRRHAQGHAQLIWRGSDEFVTLFRIQTRGLVPGDYTVGGAGTNGQVFSLPITVGVGGRSRDVIFFEGEEFIDPASVSTLMVASNNIPLLFADLRRPGQSTAMLHSTVPVLPSDAAPDAAGFATWRRVFRNGLQTDRVTVRATRLTSRTAFLLLANGMPVRAVNSNSQGRVAISESVPSVAGFGPVQLVDSQGVEAAFADF